MSRENRIYWELKYFMNLFFVRLDIGNKRWCVRPPVMFQHSAPLGRVLISNHNQYLDCCLIELYGFTMLARHIAHFIISTSSR